MENVLGVTLLPKKDNTETGGNMEGNECGICYSVDIPEISDGVTEAIGDNAVHPPDQVCMNEKCAKRFHRSCLVGWLQSIPSSRTSFGTIFGACPYCSESISVKAAR
jgi:E3 ubiquitin-protein ligase FANCL